MFNLIAVILFVVLCVIVFTILQIKRKKWLCTKILKANIKCHIPKGYNIDSIIYKDQFNGIREYLINISLKTYNSYLIKFVMYITINKDYKLFGLGDAQRKLAGNLEYMKVNDIDKSFVDMTDKLTKMEGYAGIE